MEYIVSAGEMKEYDMNTSVYFHLPAEVLMERAALGIAEAVFTRGLRKGARILVAAGNGNNGADGIASGRLLWQQGFQVTFFMPGKAGKNSPLMELQLSILKAYGIEICTEFPKEAYDVIIDALFGIGLTRNLEGVFEEAVYAINKSGAWILSADIPSGIHSDTGAVMNTAVKADMTVTFGFLKRGLVLSEGAKHCGIIKKEAIGITEQSFLSKPPQIFSYTEPVSRLLPQRRPDGNKGTFGKVLIIAGNSEMAGACLLCARAAFKTGCGMVRILTVKENKMLLNENLPEAIVDLYDTAEELDKKLEEGCRWADCILAGCGLGKDKTAERKVRFLLENITKPLVLDADALNLISEKSSLYNLLKKTIIEKNRAIILTPHIGEFSRLCHCRIEKSGFLEKAESFAYETGCILVCKDSRTAVCKTGEKIFLNLSGNSGMATAGSGDVLAGIITGLFAQTLPLETAEYPNLCDAMEKPQDIASKAFYAATAAVYLHGKAGDRAALAKNKYTLMASDLLAQLDYLLRS